MIENNYPTDTDKHFYTFKNGTSKKIDAFLVGGLIDEVFLDLCFSKCTVIDTNDRKVTISKYYLQAYELLPLIPVGNPTPSFAIWLSDLKPTTIEALVKEEGHRKFVISQAIGRIFENISPNVCHLDVLRRLQWELRD